MNAAVIVPAFNLDDDRRLALGLVRRNLDGLGWPITISVGRNAADARNLGALGNPGDVLVFNDADTLVPVAQIQQAARLAAVQAGLVFAFTRYHRLGPDQTAELLAAGTADYLPPYEDLDEPPSHGCVAVQRSCFAAVGGYDERLEVFEDEAMNIACRRRWPIRRVTGVAVHLWHARVGDMGDAEWEARYASSRAIWQAEFS